MIGRVGEHNRTAKQNAQEDNTRVEKEIHGTIAKIKKDDKGKYSSPLVQVRVEKATILGKTEDGRDIVSETLLGGGAWIPLAERADDIALRFGEPSVSDRVVVRYKYKPHRGKAYIAEELRAQVSNANRSEQDPYIVYPPGSGSLI